MWSLLLDWLKSLRTPTFRAGEDDVLIFVVGPSGSGKSSFTEQVTRSTGNLVKVGETLRPCTTNVQAIRCQLSNEAKSDLGVAVQKNVVFIDTPSFNTGRDNDAAEKGMRSWLTKSNLLRSKCLLAGIIYTHRLETDPSHDPIQGHLDAFVHTFPPNFTPLPNRVHAVLHYEGQLSGDTIRSRRDGFQEMLSILRPTLGGEPKWITSTHSDLLELGDHETAWQAVVALFSHSRSNWTKLQDRMDDGAVHSEKWTPA